MERIGERVGELEKSNERLKSDIAHLTGGIGEIKVSLVELTKEMREVSKKIGIMCERETSRRQKLDEFIKETDDKFGKYDGIIKWGLPFVIALTAAMSMVASQLASKLFP